MRLALFLLAFPVLAQPAPPPRIQSQAPPKTFSTEVKVVNVLATVHDQHGGLVRNLQKDDFILEEDGRPQMIKYYSQESDLPLTLGLLVDSSSSQLKVLAKEHSASATFFDQVIREDKDQAFLVHFAFGVALLKDLTSSRQQLRTALADAAFEGKAKLWVKRPERMPPLGRPNGTHFYDAVYLASEDLMRKQMGRKALILLSDGVDRGSEFSLSTAIEYAQRADTLVYSILFADPDFYGGSTLRGEPAQGRSALQRLSRETGGGFFEVSRRRPIETIYREIEEELRSQYSLGYTPDGKGRAAGYHNIRVATKQKGLIVQAREGYYND